VSDKYLRLVKNLTPPGRRYDITSPSAPRVRFVLFILAYLADDDGRVTASLNDLAAYTHHSPPLIRDALAELENDHGFVAIRRQPSAANTYQLVAEQLEAQQFENLLRTGTPTVEVLSTYGLDIRSLNALHRDGVCTLDQLATKIAEYEQEKAEYQRRNPGREFGFHEFLRFRGLGERSGRLILDSYSAWLADVNEFTESV